MDAADDGDDTASRGCCSLSEDYDNRSIKQYRHYRRDYAYDNSRENGHIPNTQEYT